MVDTWGFVRIFLSPSLFLLIKGLQVQRLLATHCRWRSVELGNVGSGIRACVFKAPLYHLRPGQLGGFLSLSVKGHCHPFIISPISLDQITSYIGSTVPDM